jgi:chemotaxis protein MotB
MTGRRRRSQASMPSRDRWIIPYADFVTLLFACFAALYAATALDATTNDPSFDSAHDRPVTGKGILPGYQSIVGSEPDNTRQVREALERELASDLTERRLELVEDRRGLVLAIPEAFAFDAGRADLSPTSQALMGRVGRVLIDLPNAVRVEGHTDNTPIRNARFESNWDLSTARATRVVAYFIVNIGIPPSRLSAAGYSEFHPRAANSTVDGRVRNRRVDIVILNASTKTAEEPAAP